MKNEKGKMYFSLSFFSACQPEVHRMLGGEKQGEIISHE